MKQISAFVFVAAAVAIVTLVTVGLREPMPLRVSLAQKQQLIFNGAPYFTTGMPRNPDDGKFPYYDNWVTPWSTYGRRQPSWEPDFNPPGPMDWDPTIVNPAQYKLDNPHPFEDGLMAPPDNASPYYGRHTPLTSGQLEAPYWEADVPAGGAVTAVNNNNNNNKNVVAAATNGVQRARFNSKSRLQSDLAKLKSRISKLALRNQQEERETNGWYEEVQAANQMDLEIGQRH